MPLEQIPQYKQLRRDTAIDFSNQVGDFHAVYDQISKRLLCFSRWLSTVNAIANSRRDAIAKFKVNFVGNTLPPETTQDRPWAIIWDYSQNKWGNSTEQLSIDQQYEYELIAEKAAVLDAINDRLQAYRRPMASSLLMQHTIYELKAQEANEILAQTEPITDDSKWPFVADYAELSNVDIVVAANEIAFKHKLYKTRLASTEKLRMRHIKNVLDCTDITQLERILQQFYVEGDIYGRL